MDNSTCSNGLAGYEHTGKQVCCPLTCGACGGSGCGGREGGADSCCSSTIVDNAVLCSESGEAPCIINDTGPEPVFGLVDDDTLGDDLTPAPVPHSPISTSAPTSSFDDDTLDDDLTPAPVVPSTVPPSLNPTSLPTSSFDDDTFDDDTLDDDLTPAPVAPASVAPAPVTRPPLSPSPPTPSFDDASPTPVMTIPTDPSDCESSVLPEFRYAASSGKVGKGRLYAQTPGCFTMTDIYNWRGTQSSGGVLSSKGPIYQLDDNGDVVDPVGAIGEPVTGKWLLAAELYMTNGSIFYCTGSSAGGDCDELRIQSTGPEDWYEVRGHGGSLYFEDTLVTSWDTPNKRPQEVHEEGRSFLNCVSEKLTNVTCDGQAKNDRGECRMDIINSEMGYMGWHDSESYGLTWKVRGFCKDLSNHDVFTTTNVYGDIIGSDIHHMYYGHYSYGHQGGVWINNTMHDNHQYGFDPHDDSDYLTIANNVVYNNVNHGIIASKRCNNVQIYNNTVYDGGPLAAGIFLHRSSDYAQVYDNVIYNMQDAGIAMLESMDADIHDNSIDNVRYGIRMSLGSAGNNVHDNVFKNCSDYGLFTYEGSDDPTDGVSDGRPHYNTFENNLVTDTAGAVKLKYSDNMIVTDNRFEGAEEVEFFDAQGTRWSNNEFPDGGVCTKIVTSDKGEDVVMSTFEVSDGLPAEC
eukprot:g15814.t1